MSGIGNIGNSAFTPVGTGSSAPQDESARTGTSEARTSVLQGIVQEGGPFGLRGSTGGDVRQAPTDDAPAARGPARGRMQAVADWFRGVGERISQGFSSFKAKLASAAQAVKAFFSPAPTTAPTTTQTTVRPIDLKEIAPAIVDAVGKNDTEALRKAIEGAGLALERLMASSENTDRDRIDVLRARACLPGAMGKALLPDVVEALKPMLAGISDSLGTDASTRAVADLLMDFDFDAEFQRAVDQDLRNLASPDPGTVRNAREAFLRGNSGMTGTLKALQNRGFDDKSFATQLLGRHADTFEAMRGDDYDRMKLEVMQQTQKENPTQGAPEDPSSFRINQGNVGDPTAQLIAKAAGALIDDMLEPEALKERFGQEYLDKLRDVADSIANLKVNDPEGEPRLVDLEARQDAIRKLYINDIFLRGMSPALSVGASRLGNPDKLEFVTATVVQFAVNNLTESGKLSDELMEHFAPVRDKVQDQLTEAFVSLGMPVLNE